MCAHAQSLTVNEAFFAPIAGLAEASKHTYPCPEISDPAWVRIGIQRVREEVPGGRGFLQEHGPRFELSLKWSKHFTGLASARRAAMLQDVCNGVVRALAPGFNSSLSAVTEPWPRNCPPGDLHLICGETPEHIQRQPTGRGVVDSWQNDTGAIRGR